MLGDIEVAARIPLARLIAAVSGHHLRPVRAAERGLGPRALTRGLAEEQDHAAE
jgi:hypothetical protein